ncbi:Aldehyde reductase Ahr [invertebrate metagenome]|uniref:alcohol dehydrogenase (NADP(+)) n=1 Tax=invertebrate metagenome TaxID=1711999 RepID=A0A2H9TC73_9ZZZZ
MIKAYAALNAGEPLQTFEYDPGPLGDHDVEIAVDYCGICHSDVSMINNEWGISQYPLVPGHEVAGHILATGKHVQHLTEGDRVGLGWHCSYCNHCPTCLEGDQNLCADATGTIIGHHGGFADKVRAQAASVIKLPDNLSSEVAGPLFCGGITVYNPMVQFDLKPTSKVAVIGIGGLGHLALEFLNAWGCEVTAFTSTESKRTEALSLGAHHTLNSRDPDELASAAGYFDLILCTVNVKLDWAAYINTLKPKGRLHFLGVVLDPVQFSVFSLLDKQRSLSGSPVGSPATIGQMLDFSVLHHIEPKVEVFAMKDVNQALEHLEHGSPRYRIVLKN